MHTVTEHCAEPSTGALRTQPMAVGIYTLQSGTTLLALIMTNTLQ